MYILRQRGSILVPPDAVASDKFSYMLNGLIPYRLIVSASNS